MGEQKCSAPKCLSRDRVTARKLRPKKSFKRQWIKTLHSVAADSNPISRGGSVSGSQPKLIPETCRLLHFAGKQLPLLQKKHYQKLRIRLYFNVGIVQIANCPCLPLDNNENIKSMTYNGSWIENTRGHVCECWVISFLSNKPWLTTLSTNVFQLCFSRFSLCKTWSRLYPLACGLRTVSYFLKVHALIVSEHAQVAWWSLVYICPICRIALFHKPKGFFLLSKKRCISPALPIDYSDNQ